MHTMQEESIGSNGRAASRTTLSVFAWIVQGVLAAFYGTIGVLKLTQPIAWLAHLIMWPADVPVPLVRFIGAAELAGAVGLVVPALLGIVPTLVSWAAGGLLIIQLLSIPFHFMRGEGYETPINVVLASLSVLVIWARRRRKFAPVTGARFKYQ
jgi:putative oxidoreductase